MRVNNGPQEMGFPIQKFPDQSLFAAPRNLSQRTTSFIASQRQGIHRIPLRHLIVLEIRKRTHQTQTLRLKSSDAILDFKFFEKTSFASNTSGIPRSGGDHDWYALVGEKIVWNDLGSGSSPSPIRPRPSLPTRPDALPLHNVNSCRSWGPLASGRDVRPPQTAQTGSSEDLKPPSGDTP